MVNVSPPAPQPEDPSVARQTAVGSTYTIAASAMTLVIGFTRSIILARLLFPEDFGLFALAFFFVRLLERVQMFGFTAAFIHKHEHSEAEAAAHFILRLAAGLLVLVLALLLTPILPRFYPGEPLLGPVIVALTAVRLLTAFNATPKTILAKQLQFRRISALPSHVDGQLLASWIDRVPAPQAGLLRALVEVIGEAPSVEIDEAKHPDQQEPDMKRGLLF